MNGKFDDSALLIHAADYDPAKAREYYLRTRKLKGRRPTSADLATPGKGGRPRGTTPANAPTRDKTNSRQEELRAQRAALDKRLDRLREVLRELVDAAQSRSGIEEKPNDAKSPAAKAKGSTKEKSESSDKKLTTTQKRDKAKQAKEAYEKKTGSSLSTEVAALRRQVQDIQVKIEKALEDARNNSKKPTKALSTSGSSFDSGDKLVTPRGRNGR